MVETEKVLSAPETVKLFGARRERALSRSRCEARPFEISARSPRGTPQRAFPSVLPRTSQLPMEPRSSAVGGTFYRNYVTCFR
jgi:hypothetical protein